MLISFFESCSAKHPTELDLTWAELCATMVDSSAQPLDRALKEKAEALTPVSYMTGCSRGKANVDRVFAIAIDVDDGHLCSFDQMVTRLTDLDLSFIIHSTTKSTLSANRYRVILPLAYAIQGRAYPALFSSVEQAFGGLADTNCKDASRLSILPRYWTGGAVSDEEAHRAIVTREGQALDPARLAERFPPVIEPEPEPIIPVIVGASHHPCIADLSLSPAVKAEMVDDYLAAPQGGRLFRFMKRVAARAICLNLVIDADILATLGREMNQRDPQGHRRENLKREASRALQAAHTFVAAQPRVEPEIRQTRIEKEIARLKRRRGE